MKNKRVIIICITAIILIIIGLLGVTYGYMQSIIEGNETAKKTTAKAQILKMEFSDGSESLTSNIEGYFLPGTTLTKTFSLTNQSTKALTYNILIEDLKNTFTRNDITYEFYMDDVLIKCPGNNYDELTDACSLPKSEPAYIATGLNIALEEEKTFTLKIIYNQSSENQIVDSGKTIEGNISVEEDNRKTLANAIISNAKIAKEKKDTTRAQLYSLSDTLPTTPGISISGETEKVLGMAKDSYTIEGQEKTYSYYFRGAVEDNYVNMSGMCWRIVRIQGDGSIKLVLEDQVDLCNETTDLDGDGYKYTGSWRISGGHYGYTLIGSYYMDNILSETSYSLNYNLKNWFNNGGTNPTLFKTTGFDTTILKNELWCAGNKGVSDYTGALFNKTKEELITNSQAYYFDAYMRLTSPSYATYSLSYECNEEDFDTFRAYVGGLTVDEVVYAGAKAQDSATYPNSNYYLINYFQINNTSQYWWWTLTPSYYDGKGTTRAYKVSHTGVVDGYSINSGKGATRPAVVLKEGVLCSSGDGTKTNPYVIG